MQMVASFFTLMKGECNLLLLWLHTTHGGYANAALRWWCYQRMHCFWRCFYKSNGWNCHHKERFS